MDNSDSVEYLEIWTPDGKPTGIRKSKAAVHTHGDWHRTVHVWLCNSRGELLIQKRAACKINYPGLWDISAAGHISFGESSIDGAVREFHEELGIALKQEDLCHMFSYRSQAVINNGSYHNNEHVDVYLVEKDIALETMRLQIEEVEQVKYVPFATVEQAYNRRDASFVTDGNASAAYAPFFATLNKRFAIRVSSTTG